MTFYQMVTVRDGEGRVATGLSPVSDEEAKFIPWYFLYDENGAPVPEPEEDQEEEYV